MKTFKHLSFEERFVIEKLYVSSCFLVVADRYTRYTMIRKLYNRKRDTVNIALSEIFIGSVLILEYQGSIIY